MFHFKACPKCKGDMYLDRDPYGSYLKCMQCGRLVDLELRQSGYGKVSPGKLAA